MTRLMIYEPAFRRVEARLAEVMDQIDLVLISREGVITCNGETLDTDSAKPQAGWASADAFGAPAGRDLMISMLKSPDLAWVQSAAAGFDNPVFGQFIGKGVRLTTSHGQAVGMAEYVLTGVLTHYQREIERRAEQAAHRWTRLDFREVMGTHWLIIGFGSIGQAVAQRARGFGARITGVRRQQGAHPMADAIAPMDAVAGLLPEADVVVLSTPLSKETANMVDAKFLGAMKAGSVLVNVGRGGLVDEAALLAALDAGTPEHAVLDVFHAEPLPADSPFWDHPRVALTPHSSPMSNGLNDRNDALFAENMKRYVRGEALLNEADPKDVVG